MKKDNNLRLDLFNLASMVKNHSSVLELGCGDGQLLQYLVDVKKIDGRGIEISQAGVSSCVQKGLIVIQGNVETDLIHYPDKNFDFVISSQVLQATVNPKEVLKEMLRIGRHVVISLPNFGHWKNRIHLLFKGTMPVTKTLSYQWYETPNIHFCTTKDFEVLCQELEAKIEKKMYLSDNGSIIPKLLPNVLADKAIYLIRSKK